MVVDGKTRCQLESPRVQNVRPGLSFCIRKFAAGCRPWSRPRGSDLSLIFVLRAKLDPRDVQNGHQSNPGPVIAWLVLSPPGICPGQTAFLFLKNVRSMV